MIECNPIRTNRRWIDFPHLEFLESRLAGGMPAHSPEIRKRVTIFLRVAAGLEDPSAADALR